jgi:hypothetical protein
VPRTVPPEGMDEVGTRWRSGTMNGTRYITGKRPSPLSVDERTPTGVSRNWRDVTGIDMTGQEMLIWGSSMR